MADPTGIVLSERVKSSIGQKLVPSVVDGVFGGNIALYRFFNNAKSWSGGRSMERPVLVEASSLGKSFDGVDVFSTAVEDNKIRLAFPRKSYGQPVTVQGTEKAHSMTEAGQIDLVKSAMDEAKMSMQSDLGTMVYSDGTGNNSKDFLGLDAIVDDGTVSTSYGGQTRASYSTALDSSVLTSVGSVTLDHLAAQVDNATGTGGAETEPTLIVTTKALYSAIEALLTPTIQHSVGVSMTPPRLYSTGPMQQVNPMMGHQGFKALSFRGIPIIADEKCPAGRIYFLNENKLNFYAIKDPSLQSIKTGLNTVKGSTYNSAPDLSPVQFRGWMPIPNVYGETAQFILQGEFFSWEPRRHAVSKGVTA